jgi:hypothetical protein
MAQKDWRRYYMAVYEDGSCTSVLATTSNWAKSIGAFLNPHKRIVGILGIKGKTADIQRSLWSKVVYL